MHKYGPYVHSGELDQQVLFNFCVMYITIIDWFWYFQGPLRTIEYALHLVSRHIIHWLEDTVCSGVSKTVLKLSASSPDRNNIRLFSCDTWWWPPHEGHTNHKRLISGFVVNHNGVSHLSDSAWQIALLPRSQDQQQQQHSFFVNVSGKDLVVVTSSSGHQNSLSWMQCLSCCGQLTKKVNWQNWSAFGRKIDRTRKKGSQTQVSSK